MCLDIFAFTKRAIVQMTQAIEMTTENECPKCKNRTLTIVADFKNKLAESICKNCNYRLFATITTDS